MSHALAVHQGAIALHHQPSSTPHHVLDLCNLNLCSETTWTAFHRQYPCSSLSFGALKHAMQDMTCKLSLMMLRHCVSAFVKLEVQVVGPCVQPVAACQNIRRLVHGTLNGLASRTTQQSKLLGPKTTCTEATKGQPHVAKILLLLLIMRLEEMLGLR